MSFLAIVATLSSFISCQKEIETPKDDIKSSHTVSFVADAPRTKTNATVDGNKVNYSWVKSDEDKFKVYEIVNGEHTPASMVTATLKDGLMEISATFDGEAISGASYQAVFNTGVKTAQTNDDENGYDQDSDVLVSEVVSDPSNDFNNGIALKFKRLVAVNKATLKNLEKGEYLAHTIIETTDKKDLAGKYSNITDSFGDCKSEISVKTLHEITGGTAPVNFITLPVADTKLKVTAVTIDGNENFVAAYEKTFSKGISLTQGNLTSFGVLMSEKTGETIDLSIDETTTATETELTWDRAPLVHVKVLKDKSTTNANNYYPGVSNYSSTRFYNGSTLAITPMNSLSISEIVFTATTENYAKILANSEWTNATAFVSGETVSIIPTDGTKEVSAKISGTTGHTSIEITYGQPKVKEKHSVIISSDVKNGTITATPMTAYAGENITLTATPDGGYILSEWNVKTATGDVTVNDNAFVMPDEDVTVSATFVEAAHVPVYASVAELIAAGKPTKDGTKVTVTLTDEEITKFYKSGTYTNGVYFTVGTQEVQIYCWNTPKDWEVGGTISGTLTNCDWKLYVDKSQKETWELCPADYSELTYKAPLTACATPVITIAEGGVVSIACETAGATIHYTAGDSPADPTEADAVFGAVTLTDGQTIKAIAVAEGFKPSAVASKKYTVGGAALTEKTATIQFGTNNVKIDKESVIANDDQQNSWTITTISAPSFTQQPTFSQVGSKKKGAAKSITFTTTLPKDAEVTSIETKFGGFAGTKGDITLKVGDISVGNATLNEGEDVITKSSTTSTGNTVTITVTNIANGVKCYKIQVKYKTAN